MPLVAAAGLWSWLHAPVIASGVDQGAGGTAHRYAEVTRESLYVPVRDGTRLAMNVYRPAEGGRPVEGRFPVVFAFTPYRARYTGDDGQIVEAGLSERLGLAGLTDYGYVVAVADTRGKGASFGARRGFQDRTEARDGHDLVQWLAEQPWSSGAVGMIGCSYLGGTAVHVASTAPPALRAIFAGATDFDKYAFVRRGGITAQFNTRPDEPLSQDLMSLPVDDDPQRVQLREAVAEHAGNTPMAALWYGMPYRDSVSNLTGNRFWKEVGPYTYLDRLRESGIATYFWGTWEDEPTGQVMLAAANLGGHSLIGPGSHCDPPPDMDFGREIRRWFDHHLKGVDYGFDDGPRHTWWLEGAPAGEEWVHGDSLPGEGVERTPFYLSGGGGGEGTLVSDLDRAEAATRSLVVDYAVGDEEYFAFWVESQAQHGLEYTSRPLARDTVLVGFPVLHLDVSLDQPDANVFAYLEELSAGGQVSVLSFGRLAVSHRRQAPPPYDTFGLPWHSGREADVQLLGESQVARLEFGLLPRARIIPAGSRLRLVVAGADPRQRNLQDIRTDPPPTITFHTGRADAARLELPLLSLLQQRQLGVGSE